MVVYIVVCISCSMILSNFFFQAEDGIRDLVRSRGLGDVYKRQAVGGAGKNILWAEEKKNADPDGLGFFHNDCEQGVTPVSASSTLEPQGSSNYDMKNLNDYDPMTAWIEGKPGYGTVSYTHLMLPTSDLV